MQVYGGKIPPCFDKLNTKLDQRTAFETNCPVARRITENWDGLFAKKRYFALDILYIEQYNATKDKI
jgi:hypothetical protein